MSSARSGKSNRSKQSLRLWLRLLACENLIEQTVRARLRDNYAVTLPQFDVLSELERAGEALTMSELSNLLMVSNGKVTGVVDRLERDALVKREASSEDRRVHYITLTQRGRAAFKKMANAHETWIAELFGDLNLQEISTLNEGLLKARNSAHKAQTKARAT
mgnify:CR=1 FL=1